jgi:hypothetical protein
MIAKKPKPSAKETKFIAGGASANGTPRGQFNLVRVAMNFDQELLNKVDQTARSMGLNRSAFIIIAVNEKLRQREA